MKYFLLFAAAAVVAATIFWVNGGKGLLNRNNSQKAIAKVSQLAEAKEFKMLVEENGRSSFAVEIAGQPEKDFPYYLVQVFEIFPDHRTTFGWYRFDPKTEVLWRQKLDGDWEEIL